MAYLQGTWPGNLEFDILDKKNLEKPGIQEILKIKPGILNKNLEFLTILACSAVKFLFDTKHLSYK